MHPSIHPPIHPSIPRLASCYPQHGASLLSSLHHHPIIPSSPVHHGLLYDEHTRAINCRCVDTGDGACEVMMCMMHESMSDERMGAYEKKENKSKGAKKRKKEKRAQQHVHCN
jgi:hypothetical protein